MSLASLSLQKNELWQAGFPLGLGLPHADASSKEWPLFLPSLHKLGPGLQIKDETTCPYEQRILTSSILLAFDASANDCIGRKAMQLW